MKIAVVKVSDLGVNCWLPLRFVGECHKCQRYDHCKYPERWVRPEIQAKLDHIVALQWEVRLLKAEIDGELEEVIC